MTVNYTVSFKFHQEAKAGCDVEPRPRCKQLSPRHVSSKMCGPISWSPKTPAQTSTLINVFETSYVT